LPKDANPPRKTLKQVRILLWLLVGLAVLGTAAILLIRRAPVNPPEAPQTAPLAQASFGGPFTLVGGDGKPFSSNALAGKPYAIFFGFTHCGDVCPTTLARLVKLRDQAGGANALHIVFVTVDPERDGPKEVGQYASLFNSPIIGLTGSPAQIDRVKKQYGIFSEKVPAEGHEGHDMDYDMNHTATVLLFGRDGKFVATISPDEPDGAALDKMKRITA
jgi:protein SCO1/2